MTRKNETQRQPRKLALPVWPALRVRPRLLAAIGTGLAVFAVLLVAKWVSPSTATLVGWNAGALLYLVLAWKEMGVDDVKVIHSNALRQDEGRKTILALVVLAAAAVLLAVGTQLAQARSVEGSERVWQVLLAALTVLTSWTFTQVLFAVHYAHDFYLARHGGGPDPLHFPGTKDPGYADFLHFACVIGAAMQTADISFHGRALRPVGTLHCVLSFFFNTTLVALAINMAAGMFGGGE
jgi:uncharacterized membrane protein